MRQTYCDWIVGPGSRVGSTASKVRQCGVTGQVKMRQWHERENADQMQCMGGRTSRGLYIRKEVHITTPVIYPSILSQGLSLYINYYYREINIIT